MLVTIAVAVGSRPATAPQTGDFDKGLKMFGNPNFADAVRFFIFLLSVFSRLTLFLPTA
jgi:hypothetical protein